MGLSGRICHIGLAHPDPTKPTPNQTLAHPVRLPDLSSPLWSDPSTLSRATMYGFGSGSTSKAEPIEWDKLAATQAPCPVAR